jgi:hypothetical protein
LEVFGLRDKQLVVGWGAAVEPFGLSVLAFVPFDPKVTVTDTSGGTPLKNKEISSIRTIDSICESLIKNNK